jgi:uncharacterized protein involved in exopolysaccharide biosynthesis
MFRHGEFELRDALWAIARRRVVVLGTTAAFVGLALVLNVVTKPAYQGTARLAIHATPSRSALTGALLENPTASSENLALLTTAERILSRDVLERVALGMQGSEHVLRSPVALDWPILGATIAQAAGTPDAAAELQADVEWLARQVHVRPIRDTRLVDVQAEHSDPATAAFIANSVVTQFLAHEAEHRRADDRARIAALERQIDDVRASIDDAEEALNGSRRASLALSDERSRRLVGAASEIGSDLLEVRAESRVVRAQIDRIEAFRAGASPDWTNPPVQTQALDELYRQLQRTETEVANLRAQYRDQSLEVRNAQGQADAVREAMRRELSKASADLANRLEALRVREASLAQTASSTESTLRAITDSTTKYSTLENRLSTQREVYALLLKKVREQEVAQSVEPPAAEVVQDATVPLDAVRPRRLLNLVLGGVIGVLFGAGIALALEWIRRTIQTPRDVVHALHLPVVGMLPRRL